MWHPLMVIKVLLVPGCLVITICTLTTGSITDSIDLTVSQTFIDGKMGETFMSKLDATV